VLSVALVCVMGTVQATHSHSENSTTSRHTCSICATAHAGLSTQTPASAPILVTAVLAILVAEVSTLFPFNRTTDAPTFSSTCVLIPPPTQISISRDRELRSSGFDL